MSWVLCTHWVYFLVCLQISVYVCVCVCVCVCVHVHVCVCVLVWGWGRAIKYKDLRGLLNLLFLAIVQKYHKFKILKI